MTDPIPAETTPQPTLKRQSAAHLLWAIPLASIFAFPLLMSAAFDTVELFGVPSEATAGTVVKLVASFLVLFAPVAIIRWDLNVWLRTVVWLIVSGVCAGLLLNAG